MRRFEPGPAGAQPVMRTLTTLARAVLVCAAVYAFGLGALLTAARPHPGPIPAGAVLCSHDGAGRDEAPPARGEHEACCTPAGAASPPLPAPEPAAMIRPYAVAATAPHRRIAPHLDRPPNHHVWPRGPPPGSPA